METTPQTTGPAEPPSALNASLTEFKNQRVAVALSGGVDSAVAARVAAEAGADVLGLSLRLHDPDPENPLAPRACCPPDDLQDARRIAEGLGVPFYVVDGRAEFNQGVVKPFVQAYLSARTPNPCVACNSFVKLERLAKRARALGCAALITGHYARVLPHGGGARLFQGVDRAKDQSYFLYAVAPSLLSYLRFPLGTWTKAQVRDQALQSGLPVAHKLESQEVCFVGGAGAGGFVMRQPEAAGDHGGDIVNEAGEVLGRHSGVMNYTVGQRKGLGVAAKSRLHVLGLNAATKTVTVGEAEALQERGLEGSKASYCTGTRTEPFAASVRIRYRDPGTPALVTPLADRRVRVEFGRPVRSVAPGQAAVFYVDDEVIGGAIIERALPERSL